MECTNPAQMQTAMLSIPVPELEFLPPADHAFVGKYWIYHLKIHIIGHVRGESLK